MKTSTMDCFSRRVARVATAVVASAIALATLPARAPAQIGAIGVVPGGGVSSKDGVAGTPIFTNSALMLPARRWGVSGYGSYAMLEREMFDPGLGIPFRRTTEASSLLATVAYAPSDKTLIGLQVNPYNSIDVTDEAAGQTFPTESFSGVGDAVLFGKAQLSKNGPTSFAGIASVKLPVGDKDNGFGSNGLGLGGGIAVSHQAGKTSWHGDASVAFPTDDADGDVSISANVAAVISLSPRFWFSGEVLTVTSSGTTYAYGAPGIRFAVTQRAFLDLALAFKAYSSDSDFSPPTSLLLGFLMVP